MAVGRPPKALLCGGKLGSWSGHKFIAFMLNILFVLINLWLWDGKHWLLYDWTNLQFKRVTCFSNKYFYWTPNLKYFIIIINILNIVRSLNCHLYMFSNQLVGEYKNHLRVLKNNIVDPNEKISMLILCKKCRSVSLSGRSSLYDDLPVLNHIFIHRFCP